MTGISKRSAPRPRRPQAGFTLIEMVMAIGLTALLLPILIGFVFNLSQIWIRGTQGNVFPEHVEGVTRFLETTLERSAAIQPSGEPGEVLLPVEWGRPPGWSELDDPLLMMRQVEAPPFLTQEGEPLPNLYAYLFFDDGEGLSLLWYSAHHEEIEETDDLFRSVLSPYVTEIRYCYFDPEDERWEILDEPMEEDDTFLLPQFLKLTFALEDQILERNLYLPQRNADVPTF